MNTKATFFNRLFLSFALAVSFTAVVMLAGCEKDDCNGDDPATASGDPGAKPVVKNNLVLPFFVEGANQEWWNNLQLNDVIYEERGHNPILAPDGHQVTWGEFNRPAGEARVNCTGQGTRISIKISGLIPNGAYSIFLETFAAPGFDTAYTNLSGLGVAGVKDGSEANFVASPSGEARLHITNPAGPLSVNGTIASCIPQDEFEVHIIGMYHLDNQFHGPSPGPTGSYVENFAFIVLNH